MALPRDLRDFAIYVEGAFQGEATSGMAPKLTMKVEEWIGGGMAGPIEIDQHLEKLTCEWAARGFEQEAFSQFGLRGLGAIGLRFAGAYVNPVTGNVDSVEHIMRGTHKEIDVGELKRSEAGSTKIMSTLTSYELQINGVELVFIDLINGIERYNGLDVRSAIRQAIGR